MTSTDFRSREFRDEPRSTPGLLADLVGQMTSLFGKEVQLARTELSEKVTQAVTAVSLLVVGAVFLIGAINVLLAAAVTALVDAGIAAPWASMIVAVVVAILGGILLAKALGSLKASNLAPNRTTEQVKRDAALIKEHMQ